MAWKFRNGGYYQTAAKTPAFSHGDIKPLFFRLD